MIEQVAAILVCLILLGLIVLQILTALGKPYGRFVWGGQHDVLPRQLRIGSAVSVLLYIFMGLIYLEESGVSDIIASDRFTNISLWVIAGYMTFGVLLNAISRSKAERYTMTPLIVVMAVSAYLILL